MSGIIERGEGLPAMPGGEEMANLEGMDMLGLTIPIFKVEYKRSPQTRDDKSLKEGLFTSSLGGQKEKLRCVLLRVRPSRVYWPDFDPSEENPVPICKSNDARTPAKDIEEPMAPSCMGCPYSLWNDKAKTPREKKPKCALVWNLLCLDMETGIPFVIAAKRTSIKPFRNYLTRFRLTRRPTYSIETIITAKPVQSWYVLQFEEGEELRRQDIDKASKYAEDLADTFRRTDITETTEAEEDIESEEITE